MLTRSDQCLHDRVTVRRGLPRDEAFRIDPPEEGHVRRDARRPGGWPRTAGGEPRCRTNEARREKGGDPGAGSTDANNSVIRVKGQGTQMPQPQRSPVAFHFADCLV